MERDEVGSVFERRESDQFSSSQSTCSLSWTQSSGSFSSTQLTGQSNESSQSRGRSQDEQDCIDVSKYCELCANAVGGMAEAHTGLGRKMFHLMKDRGLLETNNFTVDFGEILKRFVTANRKPTKVTPKPLANSAPAGTSEPASIDVFGESSQHQSQPNRQPTRRFSLESAPQQMSIPPADDDESEEDEQPDVFRLFDRMSPPIRGRWKDDFDDGPSQKRRRNEE